MTYQRTPQHPIGSGFSARTTAREVLEGIDLSGQLALVTGGYSGLGTEIVKALTEAGAHVVVPARRPVQAAAELSELIESGAVETDELDLADQDSVRAFADRFLTSRRTIDLLVNNAGIMAAPEARVGPGWELQFATNHLGHYALVNRLWPAIAGTPGGARVVSVSSRGHHYSGIRWEDPWFEGGYDKWQAYGQSKTANILLAVQLDRLGQSQGVRAFSLHPGTILTPLVRHISMDELVAAGTLDADGNPMPGTNLKTPEQGAATATWAAISPQLDGLGGVYLEDCEVASPTPEGATTRIGVRDWAIDPEQAALLWAWSAELTGVNAFG